MKKVAGIGAVVVVGAVASIAALYPNSAAFCKRAVECKAIADYDACVTCANPEREKIAQKLLDAHGGVDHSMSEIACVTVLWTAADQQLTTCAAEKAKAKK